MSTQKAKLIRGAPFGLLFLLAAMGTSGYLLRTPSQSEFEFHRARYVQTIQKVKEMGVQSFGNRHRWMSPNLDPASLRLKQGSNQDMVGMVEVYRDEDTDKYLIIITTKDMGHFGTFGYSYSDLPNPDQHAFPEVWQIQSRIAAHWCIVENNNW